MKWWLVGLSAAFAAAAAIGGIAVVRRRRRAQDTDAVDGGVVKRYYADMPKVIESNEIDEFHCKISLLAVCDAEDLGRRVYKLEAIPEDDGVQVIYDWHGQGKGEKITRKADADFMARLQKIVSDHDLAQHNGYYHSVSGLPDMYGDRLDVHYASGEAIHVYDNQTGFLSADARRALITLFKKEIEQTE